MESIECIVIGAGVVGIAIARSLALSGKEVLVLDGEETFGVGNSSRNSEVVHAGFYYPHKSLMAEMCVEGRQRLYRFCREFGIDHKVCGKLIVATTEEEAERLPAIAAQARQNGVTDVETLTRARIFEMEPALTAVGALYSPSTGIVDSHGFMFTMIAHAEDHGAMFSYRSPFQSADIGSEIIVSVGGADPMQLQYRLLAAPTAFTLRSGAIGRICRTAVWCRPIPASDPKSCRHRLQNRTSNSGSGAAWVSGVIQLFGIESPGLTSSLAIAEMG